MASIRETIADNIETVLDASLVIKKVVREPVIVEDLARTAMPLVFVESADEIREDISMGGPAITRQGTIDFILHLYVLGNIRDTQRNELLEEIDTLLEVDRTRGGAALDTQVIEVNLITTGEAAPYASLEITVQCQYCHTRGAS